MKRIISFVTVFMLLLSVFVVSAQEDQTIASIVAESAEADESEFSILLQLVTFAELADTLDDEDAELTLFAPTDDAFLALMTDPDMVAMGATEDPDLLLGLILGHVLGEIVLAEDFEDEQEFESLSEMPLSLEINDDDEVTINGIALVIGDEIVASNGVIHTIDAVLLPDMESMAGASGSGEACVISVADADSARVRVGPGENRTSVTFLASGQDFTVQGVSEDDAGNAWYQLDKEEAAPGRAINEAWVSADLVDSSGDCDNVAEADAPAIIPITSSSPTTTTSSGDSTSAPAVDTSGGGSIWIDYAPWASQLPANLQAASRGAADLIVQASDELTNETSCGEYSNSRGDTITVRRYQVAVNVTVSNGSGAVLRTQQFMGGQAPGCPSSLAINSTLNGDIPPLADALGFILGQ